MFLIVGLGNPGEEYAHTRHNAGFDAVDIIGDEVGARYWKTECGSLTAKGAYRDVDLVLAKPQSYMNTSGGPVKQLMNAYGVDASHLVVIHDELDIDPGTVRVKFGGGHAGAGAHAGGRLGSVAAEEGCSRRLRLRGGSRCASGALVGDCGAGEDAAVVQLGMWLQLGFRERAGAGRSAGGRARKACGRKGKGVCGARVALGFGLGW